MNTHSYCRRGAALKEHFGYCYYRTLVSLIGILKPKLYRVGKPGLDRRNQSIFTALHGMQRGLNDEISVRLSVCLSVRPSVCQTRAL